VDGWYARNMYVEGSPAYKFHLAHYGHPSKFGYKDIIPLWKAEKFDPDALMALYKKAGAHYFVTAGVHHDNFDLWDSSRLHKWNAVNMGPKKDIVALWQQAAKKQGLRFGVTEHLGFGFTYLQPAHGADKKGPLAGVPYDGNAPEFKDLYLWKANPKTDPLPSSPKMGWTTDSEFHVLWYERIKYLIDRYQPDLLYSDARHMTFEETGYRLLAHYYNSNIRKNSGKLEAVYNLKVDKAGWVLDMERGLQTEIRSEPWQTCSSNGDWYYNPGYWRGYKKSGYVIPMLCDIVSKNGNLLLNVVQHPDGSLPPESRQLLDDLALWMPINGEAIFETRPWKIFGESSAPPTEKIKSELFNEDKLRFSAADIRFTQSKDGKSLYAIALGMPTGPVRIQSLGSNAKLLDKPIASITLLGSDAKLDWKQEADALVIQSVAKWPCEHAVAFKVQLR
jgi:alpha-L-fucosidase